MLGKIILNSVRRIEQTQLCVAIDTALDLL